MSGPSGLRGPSGLSGPSGGPPEAPASAFVTAAGLHLDEVSGTRVVGHLDLGPEHHTPWGVVHGGVFASAVETAASVGASTAVQARGQFAVGVHNGTDFLRAATSGRAEVVAVPLQQGRVQQLWLVTVDDADGRPLARGQVRLQNVPLTNVSPQDSRKDVPPRDGRS